MSATLDRFARPGKARLRPRRPRPGQALVSGVRRRRSATSAANTSSANARNGAGVDDERSPRRRCGRPRCRCGQERVRDLRETRRTANDGWAGSAVSNSSIHRHTRWPAIEHRHLEAHHALVRHLDEVLGVVQERDLVVVAPEQEDASSELDEPRQRRPRAVGVVPGLGRKQRRRVWPTADEPHDVVVGDRARPGAQQLDERARCRAAPAPSARRRRADARSARPRPRAGSVAAADLVVVVGAATHTSAATPRRRQHPSARGGSGPARPTTGPTARTEACTINRSPARCRAPAHPVPATPVNASSLRPCVAFGLRPSAFGPCASGVRR